MGGMSKRDLSVLDWIAFTLVAIGSINLGFVGLFKINLMTTILGRYAEASRIVYVLVALAGVYLVAHAVRLRHASLRE
jgi:uncharacterized membrane protein YuzA (DUF378 family)